MKKLESLNVLNQVFNIAKQSVHASATFNSYPINQNSSLMPMWSNSYYKDLRNPFSSVWDQNQITDNNLRYNNYLPSLLKFTDNPKASFYHSHYHFMAFNNLVTSEQLKSQQAAIKNFFQDIIGCYPLNWQTAKIETYPITENLFQVLALLTNDPVPLFAFAPVSSFFIQHPYAPNAISQLEPQIEARLQSVNSHYLTSRLTAELLPVQGNDFWQHVISLNQHGQAESLTDEQLHLLNQSFQNLLSTMIHQFQQGQRDLLSKRQQMNQSADSSAMVNTRKNISTATDYYWQELTNTNIYRLLPETIISQFMQPTSEERDPEHIQQVFQQHPEIMTYLGSYLD